MTKGSRPRVGLISDSDIANDPRVRRQGDALSAAGFDVIGIGIIGKPAAAPAWPIISVTNEQPIGSRLRSLRRLADIPLLTLRPNHAYSVHRRLNPRYAALAREAAQHKVDLWIANDWPMLPIVLELERGTGTPFAYDTHELALDEYAQDLKWRLGLRPVISTIEQAGIARAAFVTCVSDGIADVLCTAYSLPTRPHVVRNVPQLQPGSRRPTGANISVLYHGVMAPGRALEEIIASVKLWRAEFSLTLRGPGDVSYIAGLKGLAEHHGVSGRISFAPPVAMIELVDAARQADVGLFAIQAHSRHNEFVLPNKFFEYTMAGLALCVSDLPEMRRLTEHYRLGELISEVTPAAIAASVNALDINRIDAFKANALAASKELCWEHESKRFIELVNAALARTPHPA